MLWREDGWNSAKQNPSVNERETGVAVRMQGGVQLKYLGSITQSNDVCTTEIKTSAGRVEWVETCDRRIAASVTQVQLWLLLSGMHIHRRLSAVGQHRVLPLYLIYFLF